ncbi:MAG: hypothetical protein MUC58_11345 [Rhizobiaceae bacterium]|nr:hypothetical protein [Rhizobiaceae bacterium]
MANIEHAIWNALGASGLMPRGLFRLEAGEGPDGLRSGVLVGHLGGGFWPVFRAWHAMHPGIADPLDTWSKLVIGAAADAVCGRAVYPSDTPYQPFQRWAMRAEGLKVGPLGLLMHPEAGPWHAYRGAILFEQSFDFDEHRPVAHPCDTCAAKPCLSVCPVNAVSLVVLDVQACRAQLASPQGEPCMTGGCLARNACPVGAAYRYSAEQQAFHQKAFGG